MNPSISLGRIAGVRIGVNWSWLVVFALIAYTLAASVFPAQNENLSNATYVAMALAGTLLFFGSLLLHELGHAVQARRDGVEIEGITLWLFGGVARFRGMFPSAAAELRIALAGPLVSLALGVGFVGIAAAIHLPEAVEGVVVWLGSVNLVLLVFNMLPALPLDGGRVFHGLLWLHTGNVARSTRTAASLGRAFGYLLIAAGFALVVAVGDWSGAWLALVGWFLLQAATSEAQYALLRDALVGWRVRDLMVRSPVVLAADSTFEEVVQAMTPGRRYTTYPVVGDGHALGLLPFRSLLDTPRNEWASRHVRDGMLSLDQAPVVSEDELLTDVLVELGQDGVGRALVLDDGRLYGLNSVIDLGRVLRRPVSSVRR
jgi:Zn-dependent protease/CBS domain-containing protein